ncbi:helix-turn-helix domain-containing protein [Candidatus Pacearchaeota archaeon]|nr:helix-turn-helix domain-containing protein [Candidatus Pacearchaeota archaeon]
MSFSKLIASYKKKHNLSNQQIADAIGGTVSRVTIDNICKGTHQPKVELALRLIKFFRIPMKDVFKSHGLSIEED